MALVNVVNMVSQSVSPNITYYIHIISHAEEAGANDEIYLAVHVIGILFGAP